MGFEGERHAKKPVMVLVNIDSELICAIARQAGAAIKQFYGGEHAVE